LNNSIRPDGTFGTDFWDATQLAIVIEKFSLRKRFTAYQSLEQQLVKAIQSRRFTKDASEWQGPGFYAAAIEYLRLLGHQSDAALLTKELCRLQLHGSWQGHSGLNDSPAGVWHTAQCVIVLATDAVSHREAVAKGIAWLKRAQHESGAWKSVQQYNIYFTAYAILALLHEHKPESSTIESPPLRKALEYLKSQMAKDGKCSDLGGTLMCALALRAVIGDAFEKDLTLVDYILARKNLERAEAAEAALKTKESEFARVQTELERYEKKYSDADFVISKSKLFFFVILSLVVTVFGTIAGVYALNYALRTPVVSIPAPVTQQNVHPVGVLPAEPLPPVKQGGSETQTPQHPPEKHGKKAKQGQPSPAKHSSESQR